MAEREIEGSSEIEKRRVMTDLLRAGWPGMEDYVRGLPTYKDRADAFEIHRQFLADLAERVLMHEIHWDQAVQLGACAKENVPRAMFLLGLVEEGGPHVKLPKRWPSLKEEPSG